MKETTNAALTVAEIQNLINKAELRTKAKGVPTAEAKRAIATLQNSRADINWAWKSLSNTEEQKILQMGLLN